MIKPVSFLATCLTAAIAGFAPALAQQTKPDLERMYVLYCGDIALNDASATVLKEHKAQLWIGHESSEVPLRKYAPAYYD